MGLLNVLPQFIMPNGPYSRLTDFKLFSYIVLRPRSLSNCLNCVRIKFGHWITFAPSAATLFGHILSIIGLSTKKQMRRVYTMPYVAPMQYIETFGYKSIMQYPGAAVGIAFIFGSPSATITTLTYTAAPQPATFSLFDVAKESLSGGSAFTWHRCTLTTSLGGV